MSNESIAVGDFAVVDFYMFKDLELPEFPYYISEFIDENFEGFSALPKGYQNCFASWVLARLRKLSSYLVQERTEEHNDGGGYCFTFLAIRGTQPIAKFQLQGVAEGVAIVGDAVSKEQIREFLTGFSKVLLSEQDNLANCRYSIYDPEWEHDPEIFDPFPDSESRNYYGYSDGRLLGVGNIKEL